MSESSYLVVMQIIVTDKFSGTYVYIIYLHVYMYILLHDWEGNISLRLVVLARLQGQYRNRELKTPHNLFAIIHR